MSEQEKARSFLARMLGLGKGNEVQAPAAGPTNVAGQALPHFAEVEMIPVRQEDGRLTNYPPPSHWDDWVEWDGKQWPKRVAHRYMLVPTTCFNCESGCGLLA
ncbi:MAG: hypothetical protein KDE28_09295, partial [Anaerolineales bacterium]|nr:hypothetical protein [Anaerolineales bacterium]